MGEALRPLFELNISVHRNLKTLDEVSEVFSIPKLGEKPQNPIIQNIEHKQVTLSQHPKKNEGQPLCTLQDHLPSEYDSTSQYHNWLESMNDGQENKSGCIVSWDTFSSRHNSAKPILMSEQSHRAIAASRHRVLRGGVNSGDKVLHISRDELYKALELTLAGCTSAIHEWDEEGVFILKSLAEKIVVDNLDETITDDFISPLLEMGSRYRRLDQLASCTDRRSHGWNPTTLAFLHALRSALLWVREETSGVLSNRKRGLCDIIFALNEVDIVLEMLSRLCRDLETTLGEVSPTFLLSHLYNSLEAHIELSSPHIIRSMLAYTLTVTSKPYFVSLAKMVGLEELEETLSSERRKYGKDHEDGVGGMYYDFEQEEDGDGSENDGESSEFPCFMGKEIKEAVARARRSIRILASPELEEGIKINLPSHRRLEWIWTDESPVHQGCRNGEPTVTLNISKREGLEIQSEKYKPELKRLALFDLEPASLSPSSIQDLRCFLYNFPSSLPSSRPTLSILVSYVLSPIQEQATALGRSALCLFLTPSTPLHLRAHLILLRSSLLLGSPAFKARLSGALFSDAEPDDDPMLGDREAKENSMGTTIRTRDRNANYREVQARLADELKRERNKRERRWAVGLGFGLTDREQWPPGGSDLAFYLRRVIMDSVEHIRKAERMPDGSELGDDEFWDEADSRLGFAIRDLPSGTGKEKWLDPTSIEALDFLYMEYRPPRPLRSLITPEIMSKYQRMFAFLLRLLRVEYAMRLAYRVSRSHTKNVFDTHHRSRLIALRLRFEGQVFLSTLSAYVTDTVIKGNLDAFIDRLYAAELASHNLLKENDVEKNKYMFADVYSLMRLHGKVLDTILTGCLLRGAQRAAGEVLWAVLEVLLEFSVLVGNVYRGIGAGEEAQAALRIEALYGKFIKTRAVLMKALQKMTGRGYKRLGLEQKGQGRPVDGIRPGPGGLEALSDLMIRLDATCPSVSDGYYER